MTDVFISYAREDRAQAQKLAEILAAKGYKVWWDWNLVGGRDYRAAITNALSEAKKVIVLWSHHSVASSFVIDEAGQAQRANKLVPLKIDDAPVPLGFGNLHIIETSDFGRDVDLIDAALKETAPPAETAAAAIARSRWGRLRNGSLAVLAACLAAAGLYSFWPQTQPPPTSGGSDKISASTYSLLGEVFALARSGRQLHYQMNWSIKGKPEANIAAVLTLSGASLVGRGPMAFRGRPDRAKDDVELRFQQNAVSSIILHTWGGSNLPLHDVAVVRKGAGYQLTGWTTEFDDKKIMQVAVDIAAR